MLLPARLRFDANGTAVPAGNAETKVAPLLWFSAVRLITTARAPDGTAPPVICTVTVPRVPSVFPLHWFAGVVLAERVSHARNGVSE